MGVRPRTFNSFSPRRRRDLKNDRQRSTALQLGNLTASANRTIFRAPSACKINQISLVVEAAVAAINGHSWSFQIGNYTRTLNLLSAEVTTETVGFTAYVKLDLTPDQNLTLIASDVLRLVATKTGSAPQLTNLEAIVEYEVVAPS